MDYASRDYYRSLIAELAHNSEVAEIDVAENAIALAAEAEEGRRQRHVGYWLLDHGLNRLRGAVSVTAPPSSGVYSISFSPGPNLFISSASRSSQSHLSALCSSGPNRSYLRLTALFLLIIPATQAAVDFMNNLTSYLAAPRFLPKLDFKDGIPADCATMVAVPTLLLKEKQVQQLALDLEIRYLANSDPNLYFALVTDSPDSSEEQDERDTLVDLCISLIEDLNRRYPRAGERDVAFICSTAIASTTLRKDGGWDGSASAASFSI